MHGAKVYITGKMLSLKDIFQAAPGFGRGRGFQMVLFSKSHSEYPETIFSTGTPRVISKVSILGLLGSSPNPSYIKFITSQHSQPGLSWAVFPRGSR